MNRTRRCLSCVGRTALLLALATGLAGCQEDAAAPSEAKATPASAPPTVSAAAVELSVWPRTVRVQGSLWGDEQAVIGAKVAGRVREIEVDLGTVVRAGDVLSQLDTEDFQLRVEQAKAQLKQAQAALGLAPEDPDSKLDRFKAPPVRQERAMLDQAQFEFDRAQRLVQQKIVTVEELQQKEAALNVAKARFSAALNGVDEKIALLSIRRAELAVAERAEVDSVTLAPFDGIVQQRHVAPGVYVNVGQPIVTLVRTDPLRFQAGVPERQAMEVSVGQPISIQIEGRPDPIQAQITRISPALDISSRTLMIEADVSNPMGDPNRPNAPPPLRTGLFAEGEIIVSAREEVLSVPEDAVSEFAGVEKVWVVSDSVAEELRVRTGRRYAGRTEIVEIFDGELKPGNLVIATAEQAHTGQVVVSAAAAQSAYRLGAGE